MSQGRYLIHICLVRRELTSQKHASVSQGRICSDNCICCHTEIEVADQTFHVTQLQYTDTGPTSPRTDPITPGAWQGSHWSASFLSHRHDSTRKKSWRKGDSNPESSALEADALTTRPMRRSVLTRVTPPVITTLPQPPLLFTGRGGGGGRVGDTDLFLR